MVISVIAIPAVCDTCGTIFASPFDIAPGTRSVTISGEGYVEPCPRCGGSGPIVPGMYDFVGDTLHVVSTWPQDRIERLAAALAATRKQPNGRAKAEALLAAEPGLSELAKRLVIPRDAGQFWAFIAALLALLTLLSSGDKATVTRETVIERVTTEPTAEPQKKLPPQPPRKQQRKRKHERR